jgi:hypothetical protein
MLIDPDAEEGEIRYLCKTCANEIIEDFDTSGVLYRLTRC